MGKLEGLCLLIGAIAAWYLLHGNWIVFVVFFLAVDLSAGGYLVNPKTGAELYNLFHSYLVPSISLAFGLIFQNSILLFAGLIIFAHIGLDRTLGFGLKFPSGFKDTHLGIIGLKKMKSQKSKNKLKVR